MSTPNKKITLQTVDGRELDVLESLAMQAVTLKNIIDDGCADKPIPVQMTYNVAMQVKEFWGKNKAFGTKIDETKNKEFKQLVKEYMKKSNDELFELGTAANFLDDKVLLDVLCQAIADNIKDMSVEECCEYMKQENDYTPEEERAMREKNKHVFDEENVYN